MSNRNEQLHKVAELIQDYRTSEFTSLGHDHVEQWIEQFDEDVQLPLLSEVAHILDNTFITQDDVEGFLAMLLETEKLVGDDPCDFWREVEFLKIQAAGYSQTEMLALFDRILKEQCGFGINETASDASTFIYLDDGLFTGNRVRQDIEQWLEDSCPAEATLHVIVIASHTGGSYYAEQRIRRKARDLDIRLSLHLWRSVELEDRKTYTDNSDVLRPTRIPDIPAVVEYVEGMTYKPVLREPGQLGPREIFTGEDGRDLLEQEFLKAGVRIRDLCPHLGDTQRPLGHSSLETLGFGSTIVTFRNCPNNAPLVFWAGDPWYPLFPRATNSHTELEKFIAMLRT